MIWAVFVSPLLGGFGESPLELLGGFPPLLGGFGESPLELVGGFPALLGGFGEPPLELAEPLVRGARSVGERDDYS